MIPVPPADQKLPGLATLFDADAMIPLLNRAFVPSDDGPELTAYRPRYIRYKPGTSCLVGVDLAFLGADDRETTVDAHLKLFDADRARRRAESSRMRRLQDRARTAFPEGPKRRVAFIPELNALLQLYPVDYDLRYLARISDPAWVSGKIGQALHDRSIAVCGQPELIRYKPERKALFRYSLSHGPHDRIYGKLYEDDRGERLAAQTAALIAAGMETPPVVMSLPDRRFVAHAEAVGTPLAALRDTTGYAGWMEALAASLDQLQRAEVPGLKAHRLADEVAVVTETSRLLGTVIPQLASRLDRVTQHIAAGLSRVDDLLLTAHGDFYDDQAIVSDNGLALIDLDEMRLAHPAIDAGNMLAHLSSGHARGQEVDAARGTFREHVLQARPSMEPDLDVFEAAALLKLAPGPFRRLEPDWSAGIERSSRLPKNASILASRRILWKRPW